MWADNETASDLLGFSVHKDLILKLVTNERMLPVTIGVFGDWGGGKSSVMRMLKDNLDQEEGTVCLYFNGWMFEGYDDAKAALISSILVQLGEHKRIGPRVRDRVVPLLKRVNYMRLAGTAFKRVVAPLVSGAIMATAAQAGVDPTVIGAMGAVVPSIAGSVYGESEGGGQETGSENTDDSEIDWQGMIERDTSKPGLLSR